MNPLVEKMLDKTVSNDTETRLLEDLFEHEAKCEAHHRYVDECSGDIRYLITSCYPDIRVCRRTVDDPWAGTRVRLHTPGMKCSGCGNLASECWTIRPI